MSVRLFRWAIIHLDYNVTYNDKDSKCSYKDLSWTWAVAFSRKLLFPVLLNQAIVIHECLGYPPG